MVFINYILEQLFSERFIETKIESPAFISKTNVNPKIHPVFFIQS